MLQPMRKERKISSSESERMCGICSTFNLAMLLCVFLMLPPTVSPANIHHGIAAAAAGGGNPANELVDLMNANRTASKLPPLRNSKGLGCMALQCISECIASGSVSGCDRSNNYTVACQPPETDITEVYAANCGVELPTVDVISGRLIGCSSSDDGEWGDAVLANKAIRSKEHTQVGAGFDRHGPFFFWCLLFSSGSSNSTFLLEAAGKGITTQTHAHGCFSAPDNLSCNSAATNPTWLTVTGTALAVLVLMFLTLYH